MAEFLGPDQTWERHTEPAWNEALKLARSKGWFFKRLSDHGWAQIVCRIGEPRGEDVCKVLVCSTADGTESYAKSTATRKIKYCPHSHQPPGPDVAQRMLGVAESILDSAEALLRGRCLKSQALQELELAASTLDEVEALDRAGALESEGIAEVERGRGLALAAGVDPGEPPDPRTVLVKADDLIGESHAVVKSVRGAEARAVKEGVKRLRGRLLLLQRKVDEMDSR